MFLIKLYNYIFGYVIIKITVDKPEKFINAIINLNIRFRDIKRIQDKHGNDALIIKIGARFAHEPALAQVAKDTRTRCEIIKRVGVRYFLERHKNRLGLYTGILTGLILIYGSTFFIWEVKIIKSDYPADHEIIEMLEKMGVKNGARIKNIEPSEIQARAILARPDISWLAVNIKGTIANIEIKYREPAVEIVDTESPANIIASKSGKIIYLDVYEGTPVVLLDDTVKKGELIISGEIESQVLGVRVTHAAGKILAETSRVLEIKVPLDIIKKEYTGSVSRKNKLNIFGKSVNLYLTGRTGAEKYDRIKSSSDVSLFGRVKLPMKIMRTEYLEYKMSELSLSEAEAEQIALDKIEQIIAERFEADENIIEITGRSYEGKLVSSEDGVEYFHAVSVVDLIENIAQEVAGGTQ